jgi:hypothetical protein
MKSLAELGETDRTNRAGDFACLVRTLMLARGKPWDAQSIAQRHRTPPRVVDVIQAKATVGIGGTADWGSEIAGYSLLAGGFMDSLRWSSLFYRMLSDLTRLPFNTIIGAVYGGSAGVVAHGQAIAVTKFDVLQSEQLERQKAAAIVAATRELLESGTAIEGLLSRNLRALVSSAVDKAFLDILETGAPTSAATANVETDLETMRAAVGPTDQSRLFWLTTPAVAARLAGLTATGAYRYPTVTWTGGGTLKGAPLLVSDQVDAGELVLIDATRVAGAADPVELDTSDQALLESTDAPAVGSPPGVGIGTTATISLWQQNVHAVRVIAYWGAEKVRSNAAYFLTGIGWTST